MADLETQTILKTDIRGFTARSGSMSSDQLAHLLDSHRTLAKRVAGSFGGRIFKEMGDSFLIAFRSATSAVQAAITMQRELLMQQAGLGDDTRIDIRATIATGDVLQQGEDLFGEPVNLTARMESITPAREVYVAESAGQCLARSEIELEFVDEHRFKGIKDPVRIFRAVYRHATRVLRDVTIVHTDVAKFSQLATAASPAELEEVIDSLDRIHHDALADTGGVVRMVMGDEYLMTFPDANSAATALLLMKAKVEDYNARRGPDKALTFVAGMEVGDLNIYRTAIFGPAANRADFARETAAQLAASFTALLTTTARDALKEPLRSQCTPVDAAQKDLSRRMAHRQINGLWILH